VAAAPAPVLPAPKTWQDVVALAADADPMLHAMLLHEVQPVSLAPGRVDIVPRPAAPRDVAARLSSMLERATGMRWMVGISRAEAAPTLAEQARAADADRMAAARTDPFVQAILAAFPGAEIMKVRDTAADRYGLSAPAALTGAALAPDNLPEFAPPDAMPAWDDDEAPPED